MKKSDVTILVADDDSDYLFQTVFSLEKARYRTMAEKSTPDVGTIFTIRLPKKRLAIT